MNSNIPEWLQWLNELQSIAQIGKTYCSDSFCQERYDRLNKLTAEIAAKYTNISAETHESIFKNEVGYATPKIDVRAVVIKNNQILMVKEASDGFWSLPGGWADVNTSPSESVVREVIEETGYQVEAIKLLAFYDKLKHEHPPQWPHAYKAFFQCRLLGGEPRLSHETLAIDFFSEDALPEQLSTDRVTQGQIHHMFEHIRHFDWPTDFD